MRLRLLVTVAAGLLLAGLVAPASLAGQPASRFERIAVAGQTAHVKPALLDTSRQVDVMFELSGTPVAVQDAQAKSAGRRLAAAEKASLRASIKAAQSGLVASIRRAGGTVIGQLADAYNGVHARVPLSSLAALSATPGVAAVHGVQTFTRDNGAAVPYIGSSVAWAAGGFTGKGVIIASLDTGIDYYHANFGGSGKVADFTYGFAHSTAFPATNADGVTQAFPSAKVPKGFDFVGDAYDAAAPAGSPQLIPHPDPNPLDCPSSLGGGHGSHTAGSAAGEGVLSNGKTFAGPYDANTYTNNTFTVAPGAAPQATIYAYRVFGCSGSSDIVAEAIDRAVADGANVISMSLGSPFGREDDPTSVAANNAAAAGVVVVASAGNNGTNAYTVGSPSTASRVISVAAVDASRPTFNGGDIGLASGVIQGIDANDGPLPVTNAAIKVLKNADGTVSLGCSQAEYAGTAGDIVVTARGTCARVDRAVFGQAAGAAAVIMINNGAGLPPFEGPIPTVTIPFIGVAQGTDAKFLAADGQSVTITPATIANPGYLHSASFTSGGPRNGDSAPKPDVTAPGVSVFSTGVGTGTGGAFISGTSMACPLVAGSAAQVLQAHPGWTPDAVKAALMGTADASSVKIIGYNSRLNGAGVVQTQKATQTVAYATTADHLDSLAFGYQPLGGPLVESKSFTLTNTSASDITFDLASSALGLPASVAFPASVTVPAGGTADVSVTISMSAAQVAALPTSDTFGGLGPGAVATTRGAIVATPTTSGPGLYSLRVPYLLAPRALSDVAAGARTPYVNRSNIFSASVPLTNRSSIYGGTADVYAWGLSGNNTVGGPDDTEVVRAVGVQSLPGSALGAPATDRSLVFAVNTWGRWSTPSSNEFDIAIDTNGDGKADFVVVGFDLGQLLSGSWDGVYASFTLDSAGNLVDAFYADAPMNGSTVELPTLASDLGLSAAKPTFTYAAAGFSVETGAAAIVPGTATFNAFAPTVSNGQFLSLAPGASQSLGLTLDRRTFDKAPSMGWMIVSLDDANGAAQAELVPVGKLNPRH
ncbi:MAG TPA: S8 family serine peptidase [Candidatus Dormibacteraeota bacterium]|nr:S8 family serine peptidase [Candidatus Dormibacteraeota bacterium]